MFYYYFIVYHKLSIDREASSAIVIWVAAKMHKNNLYRYITAIRNINFAGRVILSQNLIQLKCCVTINYVAGFKKYSKDNVLSKVTLIISTVNRRPEQRVNCILEKEKQNTLG